MHKITSFIRYLILSWFHVAFVNEWLIELLSQDSSKARGTKPSFSKQAPIKMNRSNPINKNVYMTVMEYFN